ncbi:MAG: diaminopimelate dehydrogenase [Victivallaceae bacterium]|nr:diaminopimelate dehydrogenase [Victivallaceae bacterium]
MLKTKILLVGYGNVGRGVIKSIANNPDMELVGILSRSPERVKKEFNAVPVRAMTEAEAFISEIRPDVAILCGGSKDDLPKQGPVFAKLVNTVDSFDNHSRIPEYFKSVNDAALAAGHVSVISTGWDPGLFSLQRVLAGAFIPGARAYGFYGLGEKGGLSMGHSDALRTIPGVADARQFTHAVPEAIETIRRGENPVFQPGDMHTRECFVVLKPGADREKIVETIRSMPGYFAPYKTTINFVSQEELDSKYKGFPHDGLVIAAGSTGNGNQAQVEFRCIWGSNPEATGNVLVAHARAAVRLAAEGRKGAMTILDIPPSYFTQLDRDELLKHWM